MEHHIESDGRCDVLKMPDIIGVSSITTACESLKHYHWAKVLERRDETPAMQEGIQLHMLVLEPTKFYENYCTDLDIPTDKRILKTVEDLKGFMQEHKMPGVGKKDDLIYKARVLIQNRNDVLIYDDWIELNTRNKEFIPKGKWTILHEMKESILNHAFMQKYRDRAKTEVAIEGEIDGQKIRGRMDFVVDDPELPFVIVMDVKKARSAKFHKFRYHIRDLWYFVQASCYIKMVEDKYKKPCLFVWLASESVWPYVTEAYECKEAMAEVGLIHAKDVLKRMRTAYDTNIWPGYSAGLVNPMDLPKDSYDRAAEIESEDDGEI